MKIKNILFPLSVITVLLSSQLSYATPTLNDKKNDIKSNKTEQITTQEDSAEIAEKNFSDSFKPLGKPQIKLLECLNKNNNSPNKCPLNSFSVNLNGYLDVFGIESLANNGKLLSAWIDNTNTTKINLYILDKKGFLYKTTYLTLYSTSVSEILSKNNIQYTILKSWTSSMSSGLDIFSKIIMNIFPILLIFLLWKQMSMFRKSGSNKIKAGDTLTFDDIAGNVEVKKELSNYIKDIKLRLAKKDVLWSGSKIELPKGIIFEGPPGNGKTMFASAVAGECGLPFYEISGSSIVELYVGLGAKKIRNIFTEARKQKEGAIIFIDEIDAFAGKRNNGGMGHSEQEQALNELLVQLDGVRYKKKNDKIIVMAATNRMDMLDPALLRAGRFDRKIMIPNPDFMTRIALFKLYSKDMPIDESVTPQRFASLTDGMCSADIKNLLNQSLIHARDAKKELIDIQCIDDAFDKIIIGHERSIDNFLEEEHRLTIYHEAGHALASLLLPHADRVRKITAIPRGNALGMVIMLPDEKSQLRSKAKMLDQIKVALAGRATEEIIFGKDLITSGASSDISQATNIARAMIGKLGMSDSIGMVEVIDNNGQYHGSPETMNKVDTLIRELISKSYEEVKNLILDNKEALDKIYQTLTENENHTISGDDAMKIINAINDRK